MLSPRKRLHLTRGCRSELRRPMRRSSLFTPFPLTKPEHPQVPGRYCVQLANRSDPAAGIHVATATFHLPASATTSSRSVRREVCSRGGRSSCSYSATVAGGQAASLTFEVLEVASKSDRARGFAGGQDGSYEELQVCGELEVTVSWLDMYQARNVHVYVLLNAKVDSNQTQCLKPTCMQLCQTLHHTDYLQPTYQ